MLHAYLSLKAVRLVTSVLERLTGRALARRRANNGTNSTPSPPVLALVCSVLFVLLVPRVASQWRTKRGQCFCFIAAVVVVVCGFVVVVWLWPLLGEL